MLKKYILSIVVLGFFGFMLSNQLHLINSVQAAQKPITSPPISYFFTISGKVFISRTKQPVAQATVKAVNTKTNSVSEVTTNTDGTYELLVLNGIYKVSATAAGNRLLPSSHRVRISNRNKSGVDFKGFAFPF